MCTHAHTHTPQVVLGMTPCRHPVCFRTTFQMLDGTTRLFTMPYVFCSIFSSLLLPSNHMLFPMILFYLLLLTIAF